MSWLTEFFSHSLIGILLFGNHYHAHSANQLFFFLFIWKGQYTRLIFGSLFDMFFDLRSVHNLTSLRNICNLGVYYPNLSRRVCVSMLFYFWKTLRLKCFCLNQCCKKVCLDRLISRLVIGGDQTVMNFLTNRLVIFDYDQLFFIISN